MTVGKVKWILMQLSLILTLLSVLSQTEKMRMEPYQDSELLKRMKPVTVPILIPMRRLKIWIQAHQRKAKTLESRK